MCRSSSNTDRKQELKKILESGTSARLYSTPKVSNKSGSPIHSPTNNSIKTNGICQLESVWQEGKEYVQVKAKKGGGCCKIKFRLDLDFEEVQNTCINYFWEQRKDICRRTKSSYDFSLVDWREELQEVIKFDGESQPFNIERFLKANKQTRPKLTLLTKLRKSQSPEKSKQNKKIELFVDDDNEEENDDFLFYDLHERPPEFLEPQLEKVAINSIFSSTDKNTESSLLNVNHHVNNANNDIENIFPSLVSDSSRSDLDSEEKDHIDDLGTENVEKSNGKTADRISYIPELKEERAYRLPPEPSIFSERTPISVRHIFIGHVTRYFHPKLNMMNVYNWVGSLNVEPELFEILDYKGKVVYLADDVESGLYNMKVRQSAINMSHHGEIAFNEFGASNEMVAVENHNTSKDVTSYKSF